MIASDSDRVAVVAADKVVDAVAASLRPADVHLEVGRADATHLPVAAATPEILRQRIAVLRRIAVRRRILVRRKAFVHPRTVVRRRQLPGSRRCCRVRR